MHKSWSNFINSSGNEILKKILTLVKGHNSITNLRKMLSNNPKLDIVSFNAYIQNLVKLYPSVLKILSGNEIITDGMMEGGME